MDPDGLAHDPRLEDVHHDEPADDHDDEGEPDDVGLEHERGEDRRGPGQERPEERDGHQDARDDRGQGDERQAEDDARQQGDQEVGRAHDRLTAQEATERARHRGLQESCLVGVRGWDDAEQEREDLVTVEDHVDRQEEHDQHRADDADAGHGHLLERLGQGRRDVVEVVEDGQRLGGQVDLPEPDRGQPVLPWLEDLGQVLADLRQRA